MGKRKMECSKKIILASYIIAIVLTIIVIIGTFMGYEVSNIANITSLVYGEVAVSNAFYFRKSAKENVPKVLGGLPKELWEQIDINQLLNE
jgi:hypothetical protein